MKLFVMFKKTYFLFLFLLIASCSMLLNQTTHTIVSSTNETSVDWNQQKVTEKITSNQKTNLNLENIPEVYKDIFDHREYISNIDSIRLIPQMQHAETVKGLAYSKDGLFIASVSSDGMIKIWRSFDGMLIRTIWNGENVSLNCILFSKDGRDLIVGTGDGKLQRWDIAKGSKSGEITAHTDSVTTCSLSNDGKLLVTGSKDNMIRVWEYPTFKLLKETNANQDGVYALEYSNDSKYIASTGSYNSLKAKKIGAFDIKIWDGSTLTNIKTLKGHTDSIGSLRISMDSKFIVSGGEDSKIIVWDATTGNMIRRITASSVGIKCLDVHKNGKYIASGDGGRGYGILYNNDYSIPYKLSIWNLETSALVHQIEFDSPIESLSFSPDGTELAIGEYAGAVSTINLNSGIRTTFGQSVKQVVNMQYLENSENFVYTFDSSIYIRSISGNLLRKYTFDQNIFDIAFTKNSTKLVGYCSDYIFICDTRDFTKTVRIPIEKYSVSSIDIFENATHFVTGHSDGNVILWDIQGGIIKKYKGCTGEISKLTISSEGQLIAASQIFRSIERPDKRVQVWDTSTGKSVLELGSELKGFISSMAFSPDSANIFVCSDKITVNSVSLKQKINADMMVIQEQASIIEFSPKNHNVLTTDRNGNINIWADASFSKILTKLSGHPNTIACASYSTDGTRIISTGFDGTTRIWDTQGNKLLEYIFLDDSEDSWVIYNNSGYFDTCGNGDKLLGISAGFSVYSIDQFSYLKNRPDIILEEAGYSNESEINAYKAQYNKREMTTNSTSILLDHMIEDIPWVDLINVNRTNNEVELSFQCFSSVTQVRNYTIFVNGNPIITSAVNNIEAPIVSEKILLSNNRNIVEISCINENGIESLRERISFENSVKKPSKLYFIGFGISNYKNPSFNLKYPTKDVNDLVNAFKKMKNHPYQEVEILTFIDSEVSKESVVIAKNFIKNTDINDTVILFIAGHGLYSEGDNPAYYFLSSEADLSEIENTSISFEEFEEILSDIPSRTKLFFLDTCASGELDLDYMKQVSALENTRGIAPRTIKNLEERGLQVISSKNTSKVNYSINRDRFIFNEIFRRTGAVIFSACRGNEYSYESDDIQNGFFTWSIINTLYNKNNFTDGYISFSKFRDSVASMVSRLSYGMQNPIINRSNLLLEAGFSSINP